MQEDQALLLLEELESVDQAVQAKLFILLGGDEYNINQYFIINQIKWKN